jgi:hypothetical protein
MKICSCKIKKGTCLRFFEISSLSRVLRCVLKENQQISFSNKITLTAISKSLLNRSLQHSIANFYREFPQLRCAELQLKMRLAGLHLLLKRVAHEQNTRLAVSSRAQRGSVADKWVFWEGAALWGCRRQANWVFNKLWQPQLGELPWENLPLSVVWYFTVYNCKFLYWHTIFVSDFTV